MSQAKLFEDDQAENSVYPHQFILATDEIFLLNFLGMPSKLDCQKREEEDLWRRGYNNETEYDAWFRKEVEEGLRDVKEGRLISNEEMNAESDALLENREPHN